MYCTLADIQAKVDKEKLIQISNDSTEPLTDGSGNPIVNEENVNKAITSATAEVDSYVSMRYKTPLNPVPQVVTELTANIAIYNLFARQYTGDEEDVIVTRYKNAVKLLEKISAGQVTLGVSESHIFVSAPDKAYGDKFREEYD